MMRRFCVAALAAAALLVHGVAALAAPPTNDPPTAAAYGARWLASRVTGAGYVADANGDPSAGRTVNTALALAAAGVEGDAFDRAVGWLAGHVDDYVVVDGADSAGNLGYLLLIVQAGGYDPTDFGGDDLVARMSATLGAREPGLFGAADPTYDGAFRQGVAILGLEAAGVSPPAVALTWLADQQCDAPVESVGGWQAYRADTSQPCATPDAVTYTGPDTNSTALAIEALAAADTAPEHDALAFLAAAQGADGGFPFVRGGQVDPNSTALVIQAIVAMGEDPGAGPYSSLLSWQLGCDEPAGDRGASASPFSAGAPDDFATEQAVWGASGHPFPLGRVSFGDAPVPCRPSLTTTEPSTATSTMPSTVASTTTSGTANPEVAAAVTTPTFTG